MKKSTVTNNSLETQQLGFDFAKSLKGGEVVCLYGDLGGGKTTFVQGLAKGLGIEKKIISPTFIIMRTYVIPKLFLSEQSESKDNNSQAKSLYHLDLYRIEEEKDVEGLGLLELMNDPENIVVIEWPEKIENLLPEQRVDIMFNYLEGDKREIIIK